MMQLIERPIQALRILHVEDDQQIQVSFNKIAKSRLKNIRIKTVDNCMSFFCQLPFENPHVIIVDWMLKDFEATYLLDKLKDFKGKVIFFSGLDKKEISKKIADNLGYLPSNFEILSKNDKSSYQELINDIQGYAESKGYHLT